MAQGWVTTARGEALNMDALKDAANLPLAKKKQTKTEVPKRTYERKPINMRGNMPAQGKHKPNLELVEQPKRIDPEELPVVTSTTESGEAETLADVTGVKVKTTETAKARAQERAKGGDPAPVEQVANEALGDILGDLAEASPNVMDASNEEVGTDTKAEAEGEAKKPATARRRTRKTTS